MRPLIALFLLGCVACTARDVPPDRSAESVRYVEIPHRAGTNLPRWAACWFPHLANPAALRRAQPCPPEVRATRTYTAGELAGCWQLTGEGRRPIRDDPAFALPVRLLTRTNRRMREQGLDGPGEYVVEVAGATAEVPDSVAYTTTWQLTPPDSLSIVRSMGLNGSVYAFRVRGDSMVGMATGFTDVIMQTTDTVPDPVERVYAYRVPCPPHR